MTSVALTNTYAVQAAVRQRPAQVQIKRILVQPASKSDPLPPRVSPMQIKAHNLALFKDHLSKKNLKAAHAMLSASLVPLDIQDPTGKTALHYAAAFGDESMIMIINSIAKEQDSQDFEGNTPLHEAMKHQNLGTAKALLLSDISYKDVKNFEGKNPFSLAIGINPEFFGILITHSGNSDLFDFYNNLPSEERAKIGHQAEIYQSLSRDQAIALINEFTSSGNYDDVVQVLEHAVSLSFMDKLEAAYNCDAFAFINKMVSEMGPKERDEKDKTGYGPLHIACLMHDIKTIKALLGKGVDINGKTNRGNTPLHIVCGLKNVALAQLLIQNGADYNIRNDEDQTPIALGFKEDFECGKQLLELVSRDHPLDIEGHLLNLYMVLDDQEKKEMNAIAPFEKIIKRKILAHMWGIQGELEIENIKTAYEGFSAQHLRSITFARMDQFFKEGYAEPLFEPLRAKFSNTEQYLSLDSTSLAKKIMQDEVVILPIIGKGHTAYIVFSGDKVYKCNRGDKASEPGIQLFSLLAMDDREKAVAAFIDMMRKLAGNDEIWVHYNRHMDNNLGLAPIMIIPQKWQTVGNCALTSLKSAFFAVSIDYACREGHQEENSTAHLRFYKDFTRWLRVETLHEYLLGDDLDEELISNILAKLKSKDRLQKLFPSDLADIVEQNSYLAEMRESITASCEYALRKET